MRFFLAVLMLALACGNVAARDLWQNSAPTVLSPDQAFQLMPVEARGSQMRVSWEIAPGYYLYRGRMKFEALEPASAKLGAAQLPDGEKFHDEHFGDVEIYRSGKLTAEFPAAAAIRKIKLSYQGCAEIGICLPPQTRIVDVQIIPTITR